MSKITIEVTTEIVVPNGIFCNPNLSDRCDFIKAKPEITPFTWCYCSVFNKDLEITDTSKICKCKECACAITKTLYER
jgi:hypothetical protein